MFSFQTCPFLQTTQVLVEEQFKVAEHLTSRRRKSLWSTESQAGETFKHDTFFLFFPKVQSSNSPTCEESETFLWNVLHTDCMYMYRLRWRTARESHSMFKTFPQGQNKIYLFFLAVGVWTWADVTQNTVAWIETMTMTDKMKQFVDLHAGMLC